MRSRTVHALETPDEPGWSRRQRSVLEMLELRWTNAQIADGLHVPPAKAREYVEEILAILDAQSRDEAGEYWRERKSLGMRVNRGYWKLASFNRGLGRGTRWAWRFALAALGLLGMLAWRGLRLAARSAHATARRAHPHLLRADRGMALRARSAGSALAERADQFETIRRARAVQARAGLGTATAREATLRRTAFVPGGPPAVAFSVVAALTVALVLLATLR